MNSRNIFFTTARISSKFMKILGNNHDILKLDKDEQIDTLNSIKKNLRKLDYLNCSFAQYKCQNYLNSKSTIFLLNLISNIMFLPFLLAALLNGVILSRNNRVHCSSYNISKGKNYAILFGCDQTLIPESLKDDYYVVGMILNFAIDFKTLMFLINNIFTKYLFHPYFCFKITIKIALYNSNILIVKPKAFIVANEESFCSSILTYYCEINNCKHINIMHGEKLFNIRDSFFKFHKCYVWHKHYVDLFEKLGADKNQFIIELPSFFNIKQFNSIKDMGKKDVFKYYLSGNETQKQLYQLYEVLNVLSNNFDIVIRPHPIWSKKNSANNFFKNLEVENPNNVSIIDSLLSADYICALYSTVLFQGYCMNKKIVVNDLDKAIYEKLKELDFIIVSLPHILLSLLLSEVNINQ